MEIDTFKALKRKEQRYIKSKPASERNYSRDVAIFGSLMLL